MDPVTAQRTTSTIKTMIPVDNILANCVVSQIKTTSVCTNLRRQLKNNISYFSTNRATMDMTESNRAVFVIICHISNGGGSVHVYWHLDQFLDENVGLDLYFKLLLQSQTSKAFARVHISAK